MSNVPVPPLRYFGGKWLLAEWIISHFPPHLHYIEPFCGSAAVFFRKPPSRVETINGVRGMVVLSGYETPLYNELYAGSRQPTRQSKTNNGRVATEVLWLNEAVVQANTLPLFGEMQP
jgi:hypothetical protein